MSLQNELSSVSWDSSWALFLDRDGVINRKLPEAYVRYWEEFEFLPGVLENIQVLTSYFAYTFLVTNQQGIGKGLMDEKMLKGIHQKMENNILEYGGKLDAIYYCPHLASNLACTCRKPQSGMALKAKEEFPKIDFSKSLMVGDADTDMVFGKNLGMITIQVL
ncbi:UNVERIFIED_CONTAM: hypothetical protein GTU68_032924, partial [Idotea baltica]|nr:hypothetical protein [Idotea baltica]